MEEIILSGNKDNMKNKDWIKEFNTKLRTDCLGWDGDPNDINYVCYADKEGLDWIKDFIQNKLDQKDQQHKQELEETIKSFQLLYGNFNSTTGYLNGYKTNEFGTHPVDLLIAELRKQIKEMN